MMQIKLHKNRNFIYLNCTNSVISACHCCGSMSGYVKTRVIYFKQKYASHAFGNIVALTVDSVNIRATCASALPTRSRSSRGPLMSYKNIYKSRSLF